MNRSKSFLAGSFFESCGTDWFKGIPVRPFYLKGRKDGIPYPIQIANKLRLYSRLRLAGYYCSTRYKPLWLSLVSVSPRFWRRCRVPDYLGDVGLITGSGELLRKKKLLGQWEGYEINTIASTVVRRRDRSIGLMLYCLSRYASPPCSVLHQLDVPPTKGRLPVRGFLGEVRPRMTIIYKWSGSLDWSPF